MHSHPPHIWASRKPISPHTGAPMTITTDHLPCDETEHTWVRKQVAILDNAQGPRVRRYESEYCTTCGLLRRARGSDGALLPELDATDTETWHQAPSENLH